MTRSVFRFLSRQPDPVEIANATHLLRLPRNYPTIGQWYQLRSDSRAFLEPWEPTWRADEMTESAFRARVIRNEQEFASGQAVPLFIFSQPDDQLIGGLTIGYIRRGAAQMLHDRLLDGRDVMPAKDIWSQAVQTGYTLHLFEPSVAPYRSSLYSREPQKHPAP